MYSSQETPLFMAVCGYFITGVPIYEISQRENAIYEGYSRSNMKIVFLHFIELSNTGKGKKKSCCHEQKRNNLFPVFCMMPSV